MHLFTVLLVYIIKLMFLSDRKKVLKLPFSSKQIKAREPEVELLVSKWNPEAVLKSSRKYCSRKSNLYNHRTFRERRNSTFEI